MALERMYKVIYEVARIINLSLRPSEVLNQIAKQTAHALDAKGCFIRVLSRDKNTLDPGAHFGLSDRYAQKGPVEVSKSKLDQDVLKGEIVTINDVRSDDRFQYSEEASQEGLVSLVVAPLSVGGDKIIGSIRIYSAEERTFTQDELDFLRCIADLSGLALENARMFAALKRAQQLADEYTYQIFED